MYGRVERESCSLDHFCSKNQINIFKRLGRFYPIKIQQMSSFLPKILTVPQDIHHLIG